jgi:Ni,Fe-hydrogenase III large subunit
VGFDAVLMQTWRIREPVMWLCEAISGNRKTYGMNAIGGVRRDLPQPLLPRIRDVVASVGREVAALREAVLGDAALLARTRGVGRLSTEHAQALGVVGPPARASGLALDARIDHPYAAYDELVPRLCVQGEGDTWARVLVRIDELQEAVRLVRELVAGLPEGPVLGDAGGEIPADRTAVAVVEAPRGEALHYVLTGGADRPLRWRVRAPSYANLQALPAMIENATIADVPITLGSLDPCFSCTERLEAVDVGTRAIRVYTPAELLEMSRSRATPGDPR